MNGSMAGVAIVIINGLVNTLPYHLIGNPEIKSPEELKRRSAATHIPATSADFALRLALKRFGIPYESIKAVMVGGAPARVAAVTSRQVDFAVVTEPGKIKGESAGLLQIPFQFTCTVTTIQMIRENPEAVQRMAKAMAAAIHYYKNPKPRKRTTFRLPLDEIITAILHGSRTCRINRQTALWSSYSGPFRCCYKHCDE